MKIDPTATDGMMDLARLGELGKEGVLALLADSTNVERSGHTPSENTVTENLDRQFKNCDQRIIVTTFASNMHRIQAILATAQRHGRKVAVTGRIFRPLTSQNTTRARIKKLMTAEMKLP